MAFFDYIAYFPANVYTLDKLNTVINSVEGTTFAPATVAPVINANVKRNPNSNPNPNPNLKPYPTLNQKPNYYPHFNSLLSEIL